MLFTDVGLLGRVGHNRELVGGMISAEHFPVEVIAADPGLQKTWRAFQI